MATLGYTGLYDATFLLLQMFKLKVKLAYNHMILMAYAPNNRTNYFLVWDWDQ